MSDPVATQPISDPRRRQARYTAIGLCLLTLVLFAPAVHYDFVKLDDDGYVARNPHVLTGLQWENIRWAFQAIHENWWLPLLWISFMLDTQIFGTEPFGYHLTNILLHAVNAALLFWALFRLTGSVWRSAFVAALFALHPLRVESVAWVTSRKDVLSGLFFMLGLITYVRYVERPDSKRFWAVAACMLAGLMSKSIVMIFPMILLLLDFWPLRRAGDASGAGAWTRWRPLLDEKIPLFILSLVFAFTSLRTHFGDSAVASEYGLLHRVALMFANYGDYLRLIAWPAHLTVIYREHDIVHGPTALIAFIGLVAATALFLRWRKSAPYLIVGWIWFLIALFPVIRGIRFGLSAYADRYTYLPSIGLGWMLVWGTYALGRRGRKAPVALAVIGVLVLSACIWKTHRQLPLWQNSVTMYGQMAKLYPDDFVANNHYGRALIEAGRYEEALPYLQRAVEIDPIDTVSAANVGDALIRLDRQTAAAEWLQRALQERDAAEPNLNALLGLAYLNMDRAVDAIAPLRVAVDRDVLKAGWRIELIRAYFEVDRPDDAREHMLFLQQQGFHWLREFESLYYHYAKLWRDGERDHAWRFFQHTIQRRPDNALLLSHAAWLLATDPEPPAPPAKALELARRAVAVMDAPNPVVYDVLAAALAANGQFDEAIQEAGRALSLAQQYGQSALALKISQRLAGYREGRPWRE